MTDGHFLRCGECDVLFRPSPLDRTPEYRVTPDGYAHTIRDDCVDFLARHAHHRLETLRLTGNAWHDGPLWDPSAIAYWPVSNGAEDFVVEGSREGIGKPLRYRLLRGRLMIRTVGVEVTADEIRDTLDRAIFPSVAPARKLTALVEEFTSLVAALDPADLELLYEDTDDPCVLVARVPAETRRRFTAWASTLFGESEVARIAETLEPGDDGVEALTVRVRQRVSFAS